MKIFLLIFVIVLIIWIIGTILVVRGIEEPKYRVVEKRDGYEIREYSGYIVAEVEVEGSMKTSLNEGFRQLAGYIFGGNTSKSSIKMTTPVMDTNTLSSESIKMTVPVMDTSTTSGKHIVAFTMPTIYTLESLPKPNNTNIRFRNIGQSKRAVLTYSLYATEGRVEAKKNLLLSFITRDNLKQKSEIISAQYNPPLSFPLLQRNEVMVDID